MKTSFVILDLLLTSSQPGSRAERMRAERMREGHHKGGKIFLFTLTRSDNLASQLPGFFKPFTMGLPLTYYQATRRYFEANNSRQAKHSDSSAQFVQIWRQANLHFVWNTDDIPFLFS